jgi:hypothetical protein
MLVKSGPAALSQEIKYPELMACIRVWHGGHAQRDEKGERIIVPWRMFEMTHESGETIATIDVEPNDDEEKLGQQIEHKIHMYCKPRSRGETQVVDVKCHFNDGRNVYVETVTIAVDMPPHRPAYGHPGYTGAGRDLSTPQNQLQVQYKGAIDWFHVNMGMMKENMQTMKSLVSDMRGELTDRRAHDKDMFEAQIGVIKTVREIMDWRLDEELKRDLHRYKLFALHAAFNKAMTYGPPVLMKLARSIGIRLEGIDTSKPVPPMERKAFEALKDLLQDLSRNKEESQEAKTQKLENLIVGLKMAGATQETIDNLTTVLENANIAAMTDAAEENAKQGVGNIFDEQGNLCIPGFTKKGGEAAA